MKNRPSRAPTEDLSQIANRVVASLYESVIDGVSYEPAFIAMDDAIEQLLESEQTKETIKLWEPHFIPHFDRAAHIFDLMKKNETQTPLGFVEQKTSPTAVIDQEGKVVATNTIFETAVPEIFETGLEALFATPADAERFRAIANANKQDAQAIVNIFLPKGLETISLLVGQIAEIEHPATKSPLLFAMIIKARWTTETGTLLQQAFGLHDAEIDTLRTFVETGSVKDAAKLRDRSIRTVRTQLSRIFSQMEMSGQTELAFFLTTLGGLQNEINEPRKMAPEALLKTQKITSRIFKKNAHATEVLEYGDPNGASLLLIQSTHPPALTPDFREAFFNCGIRVIAPLKPGSGRSTFIEGQPGPEKMASVYRDILDDLDIDETVVTGQASGGLYALEFARQFGDKCKAVCLIDTGTPFDGRSDLMRLPKELRRTMVPARYCPEILYLPHRLVARNFRKSQRGEAAVVDYFFKASPIDQLLTQTKKHAYEVTRNIIDYSFDDTVRLVKDVSLWASDWSGLLKSVSAHTRLRFVHGAENNMFLLDPILQFAQLQANCDVVAIADGCQLAAFEHPDTVVQAFVDLYAKQ